MADRNYPNFHSTPQQNDNSVGFGFGFGFGS
jgi:hypothetical protein